VGTRPSSERPGVKKRGESERLTGTEGKCEFPASSRDSLFKLKMQKVEIRLMLLLFLRKKWSSRFAGSTMCWNVFL
jgi:hypothetical protein